MSTTPPCTDWEADVLAHTSQNDRYVTDELRVIQLAQKGWLRDHGPQRLAGGAHYLTLTTRGREVLSQWRAAQPQPPPLSKRKRRAKERWDRYRATKEAWGLTFPQFLSREKAGTL
jgi:hypothetical protein